jgi:hypothetical protein
MGKRIIETMMRIIGERDDVHASSRSGVWGSLVRGRSFHFGKLEIQALQGVGIRKGLGYGTIGLGSNCKIQQLHHNPAHHVIIR